MSHPPSRAIWWEGRKFLINTKIVIIACSATDCTLEPVTSSTAIFRLLAASKSTWSDPTPAVIHALSLGALAILDAVT